MEITVTTSGIDEALKRLDPKQAEIALILWYERGSKLVQSEVRSRAKPSLRGKVSVLTDGRRPPQWARVYVKSPIAHLLEGGTGKLGSPDFNHNEGYFPSWTGIAKQMGVGPKSAFVIARFIYERGGNRPQPFVKPAFNAVRNNLVKIAQDAADEAFK